MLNPQTTCPDCDGKGLVAGALCATCGGDGTVSARTVKRTQTTPATTSTPAAAANLRGLQPERNDNAERTLRALLDSGVSSQSMLDALQLIALGGAASAGLVTEVDDVTEALADRVAASARERLGLSAAAAEGTEPKRSKRTKRES